MVPRESGQDFSPPLSGIFVQCTICATVYSSPKRDTHPDWLRLEEVSWVPESKPIGKIMYYFLDSFWQVLKRVPPQKRTFQWVSFPMWNFLEWTKGIFKPFLLQWALLFHYPFGKKSNCQMLESYWFPQKLELVHYVCVCICARRRGRESPSTDYGVRNGLSQKLKIWLLSSLEVYWNNLEKFAFISLISLEYTLPFLVLSTTHVNSVWHTVRRAG